MTSFKSIIHLVGAVASRDDVLKSSEGKSGVAADQQETAGGWLVTWRLLTLKFAGEQRLNRVFFLFRRSEE